MVIVIGTVHHNTLSIIRCLGMQNINPHVIICGDSDGSFVTKSKYIVGYDCVPEAEDALAVLDRIYEQKKERCCVISCSDQIASVLDQNYSNLIGKFDFFNAKEDGKVTRNMDKQTQVALASKNGIKTPASKKIKIGKERHSFYNFPCIVKPLESINGGKKINICHNTKELDTALSVYKQGSLVIIQEFIEKDYEIVIDGLSVNNNIIVPGYIYKFREIAGGTSFSRTGLISDIPTEIVNAIRSMIKEISYEGLFGVELIVSKGEYYFIEINLRNDATTYSFAVAGVNLPALYVQAKIDNIQCEEMSDIDIVYSIVEFVDIKFPMKFKMSPYRWFKDYRRSRCRFYSDKDDPMPFKTAIKAFIRSLFKKVL